VAENILESEGGINKIIGLRLKVLRIGHPRKGRAPGIRNGGEDLGVDGINEKAIGIRSGNDPVFRSVGQPVNRRPYFDAGEWTGINGRG
jgi:hypothetical protein